jgi:hypothetical protein
MAAALSFINELRRLLADRLEEAAGNAARLHLSDKPPQPHLILVVLPGAGLWRWRVGWGQVRTARRLNSSQIAKIRYCCQDRLV